MGRRNFWLMLLADVAAVFAAHYFAYCIRFEVVVPSAFAGQCLPCLMWIIPIKLASLSLFGLYRGMWRYTGLHDLINLLKANVMASGAVILVILGVYRFEGYSRSVFIIDFVLSILFLGGYRVGIRLFHSGISDKKAWKWVGDIRHKKKVLIIGAGDMGEKLVREIKENVALNYHVLGIVDDDRRKHSFNIHGVTVLGELNELAEIAEKTNADEIIIAISTLSASSMRRIVSFCESTGLPFKTMPGLWEMIEGKVVVSAMRKVRYEDLLGRAAIKLDTERIGTYLGGKTVLVTGGAGSIGSELCRQICGFRPERVVIFDKDESGLYEMEQQLMARYGYIRIRAALGSVQNGDVLDRAFSRYAPDVVFHAAAYKHVPMMELHPWEAVFNNILGTRQVMVACDRHHVGRTVLVSTDKAVRPTNVMGASKRMAELITQGHAAKNDNRFMAVRFGNVVGSAGSVVPLFRSQIERGGPVTVTHPDVTRYFMTIPEACSLILQAGAMGRGGEIFILKMGTPIRILDMAKDIITLNGLTPGEDIDITFTGLRPGEKLFEELITEGEDIVETDHEDIMVLNSSRIRSMEEMQTHVARLIELAKKADAAGIREELMRVVPEYQIQGEP
ncbi:MAG: polysaccharide biosynthesis protein [Deltaproteobacteria bacterium]|nr:polysaccharide biosynthesis protein [Deltaproteobacteria bacterium]